MVLAKGRSSAATRFSISVAPLVILLIGATLMGPYPVRGAVTSSTANIPVGSSPIAIAYDPAHNYVYVGTFPGVVSVISGMQTIANVSSPAIGYTARGLAYNPANMEMYVAGNGVALMSGTTVAANVTKGISGAEAFAYNPSNELMYVAALGNISLMSGASVVATLPLIPYPAGLVYDSFDKSIYATYLYQDETDTAVYVISGSSIVGNMTLPHGGGFASPVYDSCHDYVYVANSGLDSVSVISGTTVLGTTGVGSEPVALVYDSGNHYIYVANYDSGTVSILSGTQLVANLTVGKNPIALAYDPFDGNVYVADYGSNSVSVISQTTLVGNVSVGSNPIALAYNPSNNAIYVANGGSAYVSVVIPASGSASSSSTTTTATSTCVTTTTSNSTSTSTSLTTPTSSATLSSSTNSSSSSLSPNSSSTVSSTSDSSKTTQSSSSSYSSSSLDSTSVPSSSSSSSTHLFNFRQTAVVAFAIIVVFVLLLILFAGRKPPAG